MSIDHIETRLQRKHPPNKRRSRPILPSRRKKPTLDNPFEPGGEFDDLIQFVRRGGMKKLSYLAAKCYVTFMAASRFNPGDRPVGEHREVDDLEIVDLAGIHREHVEAAMVELAKTGLTYRRVPDDGGEQ